VDEGVFLHANVHKGGLQAVFQILDLSFENTTDDPIVVRAFNMEVVELSFIKHHHASFERFDIDQNLFFLPSVLFLFSFDWIEHVTCSFLF